MTRPYSKEPPPGSRLKRIVEHLEAQRATWVEEWPWDQEDAARVGFLSLYKEDDRIWKWPRFLVRDHIVLPAIEMWDGAQAAEVMKTHCPRTLDYLVELKCEQAYREAPAHQRLAKPKDVGGLVDHVIMAALMRDFDHTQTRNWNYERTARWLGPGVDRARIRRTDERIRKSGLTVQVVAQLVLFGQEALAQFDTVSVRPQRSCSR